MREVHTNFGQIRDNMIDYLSFLILYFVSFELLHQKQQFERKLWRQRVITTSDQFLMSEETQINRVTITEYMNTTS